MRSFAFAGLVSLIPNFAAADRVETHCHAEYVVIESSEVKVDRAGVRCPNICGVSIAHDVNETTVRCESGIAFISGTGDVLVLNATVEIVYANE